MNKQRQEQLVFWSMTVALLCLALFVARVLSTTAAYAAEPDKPTPVYEDWRPDISHCHDAEDLWLCITHND